MKRTLSTAIALTFFAAVAPEANDPKKGDWPMWGGTPSRNMVSTMTGMPGDWDVATKKNVKWIAALGSQTYGNPVVAAKVEELKDGARAELATLDGMGGAVAAIDYMKARLVESNAERIARIESGETVIVGVNRWQSGEPSPLTAGDGSILTVDPAVEAEQVAATDHDDVEFLGKLHRIAEAGRMIRECST